MPHHFSASPRTRRARARAPRSARMARERRVFARSPEVRAEARAEVEAKFSPGLSPDVALVLRLPLVAAPCGASPRPRELRLAMLARHARRAWVAGGSRRRSRAGTSRALVCSILFYYPCTTLRASSLLSCYATRRRRRAYHERPRSARNAGCDRCGAEARPSAARSRNSRSAFTRRV